MITVPLVVRRHEEYGSLGLKLKGRSWAEPLGGAIIAHDVLEHFPDDTGEVEQEFLALGATFYVRNHGEYFMRKGKFNHNPGYQISGDMVEQSRYLDGRTLRDPGRTQACPEIDEFIERAWRESQKLIRVDGDIEPSMAAFLSLAEKPKFFGWLRRGYRKARTRYQDYGPDHMCHMYGVIEEACDRALKEWGEYEGIELTLRYDIRRSWAQVCPLHDD